MSEDGKQGMGLDGSGKGTGEEAPVDVAVLGEKLTQAGVPPSMLGQVMGALMSPDAPAKPATLKFRKDTDYQVPEEMLWRDVLVAAILNSDDEDKWSDILAVADAAVLAFRERCP